jgi:hypothetical protein
MLKKTLITIAFPLVPLLVIRVATPLWGGSAQASSKTAHSPQRASSAVTKDAPTGTLQKMIVENGSVTMDLDFNQLNSESSRGAVAGDSQTLHFSTGANSFFPILVFNDQLRGPVPGSMALIPSRSGGLQSAVSLPAALSASLKQLAVEKLPSGQGADLAVRDSNTGFTFFNIQGHQYDYDPAAQSLAITNGKLIVSKELANTMGRPATAGAIAGTISIGAVMQPIQIDQVVNGETKSMVMPPMRHAVGPATPSLVPGPDVIVGDIEDVDQQGSNATQVGLAIGTDSCNNGDQPIDWFALPDTDHPLVPQNLYRMSGGADNTERFEQIGQSWMKHTFLALEDFVCGNCNTSGCVTGEHLCPGCSDPYVSGLNGDQNSIGSRAWVNPFTGNFPGGTDENGQPTANDHVGHSHDGVAHRILVNQTDLFPAQNPGATYYGEAAYISPHEYTWCQSNPDQCNMFNNYSYKKFTVSGGPNFIFNQAGNTVRMQAAIQAWVDTGATIVEVEPDPGNDGKFFVGYKVTGPVAGVWHYEYAVFNMNLDRAIQSFSVFFGFPVPMSNIDFHAPPQHPGWPHDGTVGDAGYSSAPWTFDPGNGSAGTWFSETFAQNPNANAIRWGTLYNFRFDSTAAPVSSNATIGFFKTGSPVTVSVLAPFMSDVTPTPTPTATVRPSPTPRPAPIPRERPTPHPRP